MADKKKTSNLTKQILYQIKFDVPDPKKLQKQIASSFPKTGLVVKIAPMAPSPRDPESRQQYKKAATDIQNGIETETKKLKLKAPNVKVNLESTFGRDDLDKFGRKVGAQFTRGITGAFDSVKGKLLGAVGISGLGFFGLATQAHEYNQELIGIRNSFATLSDAFGSANKAMSTYYGAFGGSLASLSTIKSTMMSLNAAGLTPLDEGYQNLTKHISDMTVASGIGQDALSGMTAELMANWKYSAKATREMLSSMIALGDGFGMTAGQIEQTMGTVRKSINDLGAFFKNGERDAKALARGIGVATAALRKMGVSAQTVNQFMENILDPQNFAQNQALFAQLNISYQDQMNMWETAEGKMVFMQKMLTQLPRLSQQLMSIRDPFARMDFAKTLGVPLEIVQKLGKAGTNNEIQLVMKDYLSKANGEDASERKKQQAAAEQERFSDALHLMRMRIFMPLMSWLNGTGYKMFWKFMNIVAPLAEKLMKYYTNTVEIFANNLTPALDAFANGSWVDGIAKLLGGVVKSLGTVAFKAITQGIPLIARGLWEGFWQSGPATKVVMGLMAVGALAKAYALGSFAIQRKLDIIIGLVGKTGTPSGRGSILDMIGLGKGAGGGKFGRFMKFGKAAVGISALAGVTYAMTRNSGYDNAIENYDPNGDTMGDAGTTYQQGHGVRARNAMAMGGTHLTAKAASMIATKIALKSVAKFVPVAGWIVGGIIDAVDAWKNANNVLQGQLKYSADETALLRKTMYLQNGELKKLNWAERRKLAEARAKTSLTMDDTSKTLATMGGVATLGFGSDYITGKFAEDIIKRDQEFAMLREYVRAGAASSGERARFTKMAGTKAMTSVKSDIALVDTDKAGLDKGIETESKNRAQFGTRGMSDDTFEKIKQRQRMLDETEVKGGEILSRIMEAQFDGAKAEELRAKFEEGSIKNMEDIVKLVGSTNANIKTAQELYSTLSQSSKDAINRVIADQSAQAEVGKRTADAIAMARAEAEAMFKFAEMQHLISAIEDGDDDETDIKKDWVDGGKAGRVKILESMFKMDAASIEKLAATDGAVKTAWEQLTTSKDFNGNGLDLFGTDTFSDETKMAHLMSIIAAAESRAASASQQQTNALFGIGDKIDKTNKILDKPQDKNTQVRVAIETMAHFGNLGVAYRLG